MTVVCASRVHAVCTCVYMPFVYVPFETVLS